MSARETAGVPYRFACEHEGCGRRDGSVSATAPHLCPRHAIDTCAICGSARCPDDDDGHAGAVATEQRPRPTGSGVCWVTVDGQRACGACVGDAVRDVLRQHDRVRDPDTGALWLGLGDPKYAERKAACEEDEVGAPNLDAMTDDELDALALAQPSALADRYFPGRIHDHAVASARTIVRIADHLRCARRLRATGSVERARQHEARADGYYENLPKWARW